MPRILTLLLTFCLLITGCGDDPSDVDDSEQRPTASSPSADTAAVGDTATTSPRASPDTAASADTLRETDTWSAGIVAQDPPETGVIMLEKVRTGQHDDFDRTVFEFAANALPGYEIEYVDTPVRQCGSGKTVTLAGDGHLSIRLHWARAHTEDGKATITERERQPDLPVLKELVLTCDFEGYVTWVLGLSAPNNYRILKLKNPTRLVVDVQHRNS